MCCCIICNCINPEGDDNEYIYVLETHSGVHTSGGSSLTEGCCCCYCRPSVSLSLAEIQELCHELHWKLCTFSGHGSQATTLSLIADQLQFFHWVTWLEGSSWKLKKLIYYRNQESNMLRLDIPPHVTCVNSSQECDYNSGHLNKLWQWPQQALANEVHDLFVPQVVLYMNESINNVGYCIGW